MDIRQIISDWHILRGWTEPLYVASVVQQNGPRRLVCNIVVQICSDHIANYVELYVL